jgi:hypothetical protein
MGSKLKHRHLQSYQLASVVGMMDLMQSTNIEQVTMIVLTSFYTMGPPNASHRNHLMSTSSNMSLPSPQPANKR